MSAILAEAPSASLGRSCARRCPVCDGIDAEALFDNRMAPIAGIDFGYAVCSCRGCGMVYASHSPDDATTRLYYRDLSKYDAPRSVSDVNACDLDRAEVAARFTRRVLGPAARVLDVGCSIGLYVAALRRHGIAATGLDPSARSSAAARALFDADVEVGEAEGYEGYGDFDGVALLAVLEHLRDPRRLMARLGNAMKPGAMLVVEVPNADVFGAHPRVGVVSEPFGEFSNEHINFFGESSLCRLASDAGFAFVASEPFRYTIGIEGLLAVFRKGTDGSRPHRHERAADSVRRYVANSLAGLRPVEARLERLADAGRPLVLYGAGSHSARLLAQGALGRAPIDFVVDRNPHLESRAIGTLPIRAPGALASAPDHPVVVSSFYSMRPIVDYLATHVPNDVVPLYPAASGGPTL